MRLDRLNRLSVLKNIKQQLESKIKKPNNYYFRVNHSFTADYTNNDRTKNGNQLNFSLNAYINRDKSGRGMGNDALWFNTNPTVVVRANFLDGNLINLKKLLDSFNKLIRLSMPDNYQEVASRRLRGDYIITEEKDRIIDSESLKIVDLDDDIMVSDI
jgi:hypothetical protein